MANLSGVVRQLKAERDQVSREVERLDAALAALNGSYGSWRARRGTLSTAARARIAAAQRARWAKVRAGNKGSVMTMPKKRTLSASARARIAKAQRLRWRKFKAAQKKG
jgi:hypothetical protein